MLSITYILKELWRTCTFSVFLESASQISTSVFFFFTKVSEFTSATPEINGCLHALILLWDQKPQRTVLKLLLFFEYYLLSMMKGQETNLK